MITINNYQVTLTWDDGGSETFVLGVLDSIKVDDAWMQKYYGFASVKWAPYTPCPVTILPGYPSDGFDAESKEAYIHFHLS